MNLANKLTIFRIILVPIIMIIPFLNIQGEFLGVSISYIIIGWLHSTFKKSNHNIWKISRSNCR